MKSAVSASDGAIMSVGGEQGGGDGRDVFENERREHDGERDRPRASSRARAGRCAASPVTARPSSRRLWRWRRRLAAFEFQGRKWFWPSRTVTSIALRAASGAFFMKATFANGTRSSFVPWTMVTGTLIAARRGASASSCGSSAMISRLALRSQRGSSALTGQVSPTYWMKGTFSCAGSSEPATIDERGDEIRTVDGDLRDDRAAERVADEDGGLAAVGADHRGDGLRLFGERDDGVVGAAVAEARAVDRDVVEALRHAASGSRPRRARRPACRGRRRRGGRLGRPLRGS